MDAAEILAAIADIARERLGWRRALRPEARLVEDLGLDSIRLLELAVAVENRFRIRLDEEEEVALVTVGDLVAVIERKAGAGDAA